MNMKFLMLVFCVLAQGVIDETWAREGRYDLGYQWTPETARADLIVRFRYANDLVKFQEVNRFFNQMPYNSDVAGYSLQKKQALLDMNVEPYRLRLAHVKHRETQEDLVVLLVYLKGNDDDALVLDSFHPWVEPLSERHDLFLIEMMADGDVNRVQIQ